MIWKLASVFSLALCVVAHEAISEQKVILKNTEHTGHHGELVHIGPHAPEHHEEYAWSYPSYEFSYQVNDPHTHDHKGQHEVREGDVVKGEYWLEEPDGRKRTVKYHADKHSGFNAHVEYSAPHQHVHFKTHKHLEHKPMIEHHEEPVIKHIPIIEHHHEEEHKPVIKHIPVIAHHHHEIKHHHEEKHRPLIKHIPVIDHHHEIKHHHEHKPYIHIKPVLEDHHEEHIPILLHKPVIEHHYKKHIPIYVPKPVHHHYQPLIVHKHEHKPILEHHDVHHDHHVPWVSPRHHGHHDDHHQPILRRLQENYLRDQHSRFYRSYLLYLAVALAAVCGDEEPRYLRNQDPLRYNPHDRVYNLEAHDEKQKEVLQDFNSPDYYQPNLVVDYRYLRTGGREYVQGPGGQYIILPHGVKSPQKTAFRNFDQFLDYIQHKQYNKGRISKEDYGVEDGVEDEVEKYRSRERIDDRSLYNNPYH